MNIIIIEDDLPLQQHLTDSLHDFSNNVIVFSNLDFVFEKSFSTDTKGILVLDRLVGDHDTKDYLLEIKELLPRFQVLILSAIDSSSEKAELLNLGADDYLSKPFDIVELKARVLSLSRRVNTQIETQVFGDLSINPLRRLVTCRGVEMPLSVKEYLLMVYLISANKKIISKEELLDAVWGSGTFLETNTLFVTVANLRKKLEEFHSVVKIKNIRNLGYLIES